MDREPPKPSADAMDAVEAAEMAKCRDVSAARRPGGSGLADQGFSMDGLVHVEPFSLSRNRQKHNKSHSPQGKTTTEKTKGKTIGPHP
jgi:hypothetical protein